MIKNGTLKRCDLPVQVERENILLHFLLAHHHIKNWRDPIHSNARIGHTKNTIKLGCDEGYSRLLDGFSEYLVLNVNVPNLKDKQ